MMLRPYSLFLLSFLLGGCLMQNLSPTEKLRDVVIELNDQSRWERLDLAIQRVHPAYRTAFRVSRADWSQRIEISEVEVLSIKRGIDKEDSAQSIVSFNWYDKNSMTAHSTKVEQIWTKVRRDYMLRSENIVAGAPELLNLSISQALSGNQTVRSEAN
jgi:hypothetical protein